MTNYRARLWEIEVFSADGTSSIDVSRACSQGPVLKGSPWGPNVGQKGYHQVTTSIVIVPHPDVTESLDTDDTNHWAKGNKVKLWTYNSAGVRVLHRTLRIIKPWFDDGLRENKNESPSLSLELGDLFALKASRYPPQDLSRLIVSTSLSLRDYANYWLRYFGLPEITTLLGEPALTETVNFSIQYPGNTFPCEFIGGLLYGVGGYTMWVDSQERIRVVKGDLTPTTAPFNWEARDLKIWNRPQQRSEDVAGTVRVTGTTNYVIPYTDPACETSTTTTANLTTTTTVCISTTALSQTITKTSNSTVTGFSSNTGGGGSSTQPLGDSEEIVERTYGGGTPDAPNPNPVYPATPGIPDHLQRVITTVKEQLPTGGGGSNANLSGLGVTKKITEDYYYRTKYVLTIDGTVAAGVEVRKIITTTELINPSSISSGGGGGGSSFTLLGNSVVTKEWIETAPGSGRYLYIETALYPRETEDRRSTTTQTEPGKSSPPGVEYAPASLIPKQEQRFGIARFQYPLGAPDNDHPLNLDFGQFLPSNDRAKLHAELEGEIVIGRFAGRDIGFLPSDAWLVDPKPLQNIFVQVDEFTDKVYLLDIPVLVFGEKQFVFACTGIYGGRRDRTTGVITKPWNPVEPPGDYLTTVAGDRLTTVSGDPLVYL